MLTNFLISTVVVVIFLSQGCDKAYGPGGEPPLPPESPSSEQALWCVDLDVNCPSYASQDACKTHTQWMSQMCRMSCGLCGSTGGGTLTPTPTPTPTKTTAPAPAPCQDQNKFCNSWAQIGYCHGGYAAYMSANCKKSCGKCASGGAPTAAPGSTPAPTPTTGGGAPTPMPAPNPTTGGGDPILTDALELARLVNEHRAKNGLQKIKLSAALMAVASAKVKDANRNSPASGCFMPNSWSSGVSSWWKGCCYTLADKGQSQCMQSKGKEITACWKEQYTGNVFENTFQSNSRVVPADAFAMYLWGGTSLDQIMNSGTWASYNPWPAMGVGIEGGYGVLIFGDRADTTGDFLYPGGGYEHCGPDDYRPVF